MDVKPEALVLMAKAPVEGTVKTRLIGTFSAAEVTELYVNFLRDTFRLMEEVQAEREDLALVLCYTPEGAEEAFEEVEREGCLMMAQRGADLGERIVNCLADLFGRGYGRIVVIGADAPALPADYILDALEELTDEETVAVGPTLDGGYYLIGLSRPAPELFTGVAWSTGGVLEETRARIAAAGMKMVELAEFIDVDTPEDLAILEEVLAEDPTLAPRTRRNLRQLRRASARG